MVGECFRELLLVLRDGLRMASNRKTIEERLEFVERELNWMRPVVTDLAKQLDISRPRINPMKYCRDDLDRQIMSYLIDNLGAGATEIAKALGLEEPEHRSRHLVGKRLNRLFRLSSADGWQIMHFDRAHRQHPTSGAVKYRAWWLNLEELDVKGFKEELNRTAR